jgi:hypothetical protein
MRPIRPSTRAVPAALLTFAALGMLAPSAHAQSIWLDRTVPRSIHLELAKPMLETDADGFLTFNTYLSTRLPLGRSLSFVGELPVAMLEIESSFFEDETSTAFGNPYVGIESHVNGESGGWFEFGVRVPLASEEEEAVVTGIIADVDRWEAFFPNAVFVRGAAHWRLHPRPGGVGADFRFAPILWIPEEEGETEMFATYGAQVLFQATNARGGAGITGRWFVTDDGDGDATAHQFEAAFDFLSGDVRPGLTLRVPLDDELLIFASPDATIGLTVNILL